MNSIANLQEKIEELKVERNAVILAHNYQPLAIQEIADIAGDSLELSRQAAESEGEVIVFCGVHFMAEVASILAPQKTVLLPEAQAGCPLADYITGEALREAKQQFPQAEVVCYVNSSAEVKAESDICVTSSNAVEVVASIESPEILFVPDQNLGAYVAQQTGKDIRIWKGYCPSHHVATAADVSAAREKHPQAALMVHPECRPEVVEQADVVLSTGKMLKYARESQHHSLVVGTETGIIPRLQRENPGKEFYPLSPYMVCPDMKKITLQKLLSSLEMMGPQVTVPEAVANRARKSLDRMLEFT